MDSEDGWVKISNRKDIGEINFEVEDFYTAEDLETAKAKRVMIEEEHEAKKAAKKAAKAAKAAKAPSKTKETLSDDKKI
jgi:hypothetical protein